MQARVQDDLAGLTVMCRLEFKSEPSMSLDGFVVVDRGNGIGESEKVLRRMIVSVEPGGHQPVLMLQHFREASFANVPSFFLLAIDGVGKILVVRRDCFRNCP